jgi:hypothetical protein
MCRARAKFLATMVLLLLPAAEGPLQAEERTKAFPSFHCKYTLPGADWSWGVPSSQPALLVATNPEGLRLVLVAERLKKADKIDEEYAEDYEKGVYGSGGIKKRGGKLMTFKGLACYQTEAILPNEKTIVGRVFIAHGNVYDMYLTGLAEPVEQRADLDTIMNGFEFTKPPPTNPATRPDEEAETTREFFRQHGRITTFVLVGVGIFFLIRWLTRKKPTPKVSGT